MQQDCHFFPTESFHNVLVISGLSHGADGIRFGYGKEKKSIDTLGGKRKFLIKGFVLQGRCHSNLLIFFEAARALFVFQSTKVHTIVQIIAKVQQ